MIYEDYIAITKVVDRVWEKYCINEGAKKELIAELREVYLAELRSKLLQLETTTRFSENIKKILYS